MVGKVFFILLVIEDNFDGWGFCVILIVFKDILYQLFFKGDCFGKVK